MYAHPILHTQSIAKHFSHKTELRMNQYSEPMFIKAYEIPVLSCLKTQRGPVAAKSK